ncbi:MAG: helix-turn-helix domain-containing protein [Holophagae bacterium]|jgi:DNA-binding NtrC family response regulator
MFKLAIDTGSGSELTYELDRDSVSVGASAANDVVLTAPGVAPTHLVIRRSGEAYTFVGQPRQIVLLNGERRSRGVLNEGDRLRIGTTSILVSEAGRDAPEPEVPIVDEPPTDPEPQAAGSQQLAGKQRAEVALFNEPERLAMVRRLLIDVFQPGVQADMVTALEEFLEKALPGRRSMLAWLDQKGRLQPIVSLWRGAIPQLPSRTFAELAVGGRVAVLRGLVREMLIYPVPLSDDANVYLLAESDPQSMEEDRIVLAELASALALNWEKVSSSSALLGQWQGEATSKLEARLPGSSQAVAILREQLLSAARSPAPVMLFGRAGVGRAYLASLIASLCPTGKPWIRIVQVRDGDHAALRTELFGSPSTIGVRGLAERAGGGVVVVRDIHQMPIDLQRETAAAIREDSKSGFAPKVRWIATADEDCLDQLADGRLDGDLLGLMQIHLIRVPALAERREDLPLIIVRNLESVAAEQGKQVRGIALGTLDSLLGHPFDGQMTELLSELRRLVSATPDGETVSGSPGLAGFEGVLDGAGDGRDTSAVLGQDDLKVVIPAVERMLIDRVLRRSLGNQSQAARELNLSRGALIAKIKEYGIPDYRSLRRNK